MPFLDVAGRQPDRLLVFFVITVVFEAGAFDDGFERERIFDVFIGTDEQGKLYIIDEMLTPDSSRFWPVDEYKVGMSPPSFDKQFVRDYLETLDWDKTAPGPDLPPEILEKSAKKYREAFERLTAT